MNILLPKKDKIRIIITDSGLGGLSVQALLDKHLRSLKNNFDVELIFFNSLASHNLGYNTIKSTERKLNIFNNAILAMLNLKPDMILIACNTLSALYPLTEVSNKVKIPVISIIDLAIEMVTENFSAKENGKVIILGTETTIKSNIYKEKLLGKNFRESQIILQVCKNLESEIQIDPNSETVELLIEKCIDKALKKSNFTNGNIFVVLACTHYGYSKNIFEEKLYKKFGDRIKVLNPNEKMGEIIEFKNNATKNFHRRITNKVISQVDIGKTEMQNLSSLLEKDSPQLAEALSKYVLDENLFKIE